MYDFDVIIYNVTNYKIKYIFVILINVYVLIIHINTVLWTCTVRLNYIIYGENTVTEKRLLYVICIIKHEKRRKNIIYVIIFLIYRIICPILHCELLNSKDRC